MNRCQGGVPENSSQQCDDDITGHNGGSLCSEVLKWFKTPLAPLVVAEFEMRGIAKKCAWLDVWPQEHGVQRDPRCAHCIAR